MHAKENSAGFGSGEYSAKLLASTKQRFSDLSHTHAPALAPGLVNFDFQWKSQLGDARRLQPRLRRPGPAIASVSISAATMTIIAARKISTSRFDMVHMATTQALEGELQTSQGAARLPNLRSPRAQPTRQIGAAAPAGAEPLVQAFWVPFFRGRVAIEFAHNGREFSLDL
jgi:hypothetical protein